MATSGQGTRGAGATLVRILGLSLSLFSAAAVVSLGMDVWGWHWCLAALLVAMPFFLRLDVVVAPLAFWGMTAAWGWPLPTAVLMVLSPVILSVIIGGAGALLGVAGRRGGRRLATA